jgi:hypothetical protein
MVDGCHFARRRERELVFGDRDGMRRDYLGSRFCPRERTLGTRRGTLPKFKISSSCDLPDAIRAIYAVLARRMSPCRGHGLGSGVSSPDGRRSNFQTTDSRGADMDRNLRVTDGSDTHWGGE